MQNLSDVYRPNVFEDIVGQAQAVRTLARYVEDGERGRFLLVGPYGSGKTSLARILAKALLCRQRPPADGLHRRLASPCNICADCRDAEAGFTCDTDMHPRLAYRDCGRDRGVEMIRDLVSRSRQSPGRSGDRHVVVLDEVHNLQGPGFAALNEILGAMPAHATYLLLTTEDEAVAKAVGSRCTTVRTEPLDTVTAEDYARRVCREQGLTYEDGALGVLVDLADGHVRDLVKYLGQVGTDGPINLEAVRRHFPIGDVLTLADYLDAVLADDLQAQLDTLDGWQAEPRAKFAALQRLLIFLFVNDVMMKLRPDRTLADLGRERRARIVAGFSRAAAAHGLTPRRLWEKTIAFWTISPLATSREVFSARVIGFHAWMNPELSVVTTLPAARVPPTRVVRTRQVRGATAPGASLVGSDHRPLEARLARETELSARSSEASSRASLSSLHASVSRLTMTEARKIWDAGSFLAREHGLALNARLRFDHARLGQTSRAAGADFLSRFLHELNLALARWESGPRRTGDVLLPECQAHWLYVQEIGADGGLVSHVAAYIPLHRRRDVRHWLYGTFLATKCGSRGNSAAICLRHHGTPPGLRRGTELDDPARVRAHQRHTRLLRLLCRNLDPALQGRDAVGGRRELAELLGIRARLQATARSVQHLRVRVSNSIGPGQQRAERERGVGLGSPFAAQAWAFLGCGWELREHADRGRWRGEAVQRRVIEARMAPDAALSDVGTPFRGKAIERELLRYDPRWMQRSWSTWQHSTEPSLRYQGDRLLDDLDTWPERLPHHDAEG